MILLTDSEGPNQPARIWAFADHIDAKERDTSTIALWNVIGSAAVASWLRRHHFQRSVASVGNPR